MIGDQGEAAVIAFDHRLRRMQEFTNDADKINEALKKIQAGSYTSRQVDAVNDAINMLRSRPPNRRRIVLLVSETRGKGNEGRVRDVLIASQVHNVIIYAVDISRMVTSLTAKQQAPRPDPLPPPARQGTMPAGVPATPTTVAQTFGGQGGRAEFIPLFVEILKDVKSIFVDNPSEVLTKGSGGAEYSFFRQRGLEDAIEKMGEELHSQYLIAYTPNNKDEGGFHQIDVTITGRRDLKVRTRPGYWLATKQ
jgi:VWFA-related protein